jgi:hypothetical protein
LTWRRRDRVLVPAAGSLITPCGRLLSCSWWSSARGPVPPANGRALVGDLLDAFRGSDYGLCRVRVGGAAGGPKVSQVGDGRFADEGDPPFGACVVSACLGDGRWPALVRVAAWCSPTLLASLLKASLSAGHCRFGSLPRCGDLTIRTQAIGPRAPSPRALAFRVAGGCASAILRPPRAGSRTPLGLPARSTLWRWPARSRRDRDWG